MNQKHRGTEAKSVMNPAGMINRLPSSSWIITSCINLQRVISGLAGVITNMTRLLSDHAC